MEQKKINLALIFSLCIFGVGVAVKNLANYFGGFGITFVAVLVLTALFVLKGFLEPENRRRLWDVFVLICVSIFFCLVTYCAYDWAMELDYGLFKFIRVWSNIYSVLSLIFLIYTAIRFISESSEKRFVIFEYILGTKKIQSKVKINQEKYNRQPREVVSGEIEQKPNQVEQDKKTETIENNVTAEGPVAQEEKQEPVEISTDNNQF